MTLEEAIEYFKMKVSAREAIGNDIGTDYEAYKIALTALHPVSREQVETVWRGEWISTGAISCKCSKCNKLKLKSSADEYNFCPHCMAAMTDEAVEMVMERLEALYDNRT